MSTKSTKRRTQKASKIGQRGGPEIFFWHLQDGVFFQRFGELNNAQLRFFLGLRKSWIVRGGTALIVEERKPRMTQFAGAAKDVAYLIDEGFIVREDVHAIARRIKSEHAAVAARATS